MKLEGGQFEFAEVVSAAQAGSLSAARQLIERYQHDLLSIAYLQTGDRAAASELAGRVCGQALEQIRDYDPEEDFYPWLLRHIPMTMLVEDGPPAAHRSGVGPGPSSDSARYQVDDERSRFLHALELLSPHERLQLILSDYAGLSESDAAATAAILPAGSAAARSPADVRRRLRALASLDAGQSIANALRRVAVDTPRAALWEDIEGSVAGGFARQRFRSRLSSFAAVVVALTLLGGVGLFLLYGALGSDGATPGGGALGPPSPTAASPTATAVTTATPAPYMPPGDVPDGLLVELASAGSTWGIADPSGVPGARSLPAGELAGISPDGGTLLLIYQEWHADRVDMTLVAASSATGEEFWRADVRPLAEGGPDSLYFDLVVVDDLVYVASHDSGYLENVLTIAVIRMADGTLRDIWGLNVGVEFSGPGLAVSLYGTVAPAAPVLTVHIESHEHGWHKLHQIDLRTGATLFDSEPVPGLGAVPGQRLLAPDGRGLIIIPPSGLSAAPAITYLIFDTMTQGEIILPFREVDALDGVVVAYVLAHDGRRLYALDSYNQQVALINLERRQVEQVIDVQGLETFRNRTALLPPWARAADLPGNPAALAPDGRWLYALSPLFTLPGEPQPPPGPFIWKIDTQTWTIEAEWLLGDEAPAHSVFVDSDGARLYVQQFRPEGDASEDAPHTNIVSSADGMLVSTPGALAVPVRSTIAEFYRQHYGRSPSIAGVIPRDISGPPTMPIVDVAVNPASGLTDSVVDITVALLDPVTGDLLTDAAAPQLRSPNPVNLFATFNNGAERRTAILGRASDGHYQGQLKLDLPGAWDLTLTAGDPASDGWRVLRPAAVELFDATTGPDGRAYVLDAFSVPERPVAGQEVELTVRIVPAFGLAATGVDDEMTPFLPDTFDLIFPDGSTATLRHSGFLTYSGVALFPTPGVTFATVAFTFLGDQPTTLTLRVEVDEHS